MSDVRTPVSPDTRRFLERAGATRPWVVGGMAYGISGVALVTQAARQGCLAFYGAAGLPLDQVRADLHRLPHHLPVGLNIAHHPHPRRDADLVTAALQAGVRRVECSAFLRPTVDILRFRFSGRAPGEAPRFVMAKVSRLAAATIWARPPTARLLQRAVCSGALNHDEARAAAAVPCADAITLEGDSGGHTDRRSWMVGLPAFRHEIARTGQPVVIGVAGSLGTPDALRMALQLGAAYGVGGSIHQTCAESGVRDDVRRWLRAATVEDFSFVASPQYFGEEGRVQVLSRPTPFAFHARKLVRIWRDHGHRPLTGAHRTFVEELLQADLDEAWTSTADWLQAHSPHLLHAALDPSRRLALLCRGWLVDCARRATRPHPSPDVQVFSGPAVVPFHLRLGLGPDGPAPAVAEVCRFMHPTEAVEPAA